MSEGPIDLMNGRPDRQGIVYNHVRARFFELAGGDDHTQGVDFYNIGAWPRRI